MKLRNLLLLSLLSLLFAYGCADGSNMGTNACGGIGPLEHIPGDECGDCGQYVCDGSETLKCDDPGTNACGGCIPLTHQPGEVCGNCGTYVCSGNDAVKCDDSASASDSCSNNGNNNGSNNGNNNGSNNGSNNGTDTNACGGTATLPHQPGESCGDCMFYECDGSDNVVCTDTSNACGGCDPLPHQPGDSCGTCGSYACAGLNSVVCANDNINACGGCSQLPGTPGDHCGDCGTYECDGSDALRCDDPGSNACGGCSQLSATPGDHCGTCGTYACSGLDSVVCANDNTNACGGCSQLPTSPGTTCACGEGAWHCSGTDALTCAGAVSDTSAATRLRNYDDGDNSESNIVVSTMYPPDGDSADWWYFWYEDETFSNMELELWLNSPSGIDYDMCVYFQSSAMDGCSAGTYSIFSDVEGCCGDHVKFILDSAGDGSGWVYIRVYYVSGSATCDSYDIDAYF